jgi:3-oxoadipate enol-lactonase
VTDRLGVISCPTLVASGRYDGIAPVANGEAIATRVPDATLRVYEGGHAFFVQDRSALPEILDFLGAGATTATSAGRDGEPHADATMSPEG